MGHVYRDRFLSEPITSHRYLVQCIKYIHFNPVKARSVERCKDYKFSSYNYFKKRLEREEFINGLDKSDYEDICNNIDYNISFLDIEEDKKEKIIMGIQEFIKDRKYEIYEMFLDRKILEEMVFYLKNEKCIKYTQISEFLEITRGTMQRIIINNRERNKRLYL